MKTLSTAQQAGLMLAAFFGLPVTGLIFTAGLKAVPFLLLPAFAYFTVRWQCRIAHTLKAAAQAWKAAAHFD